jgi:putative hydrolase of HD superfamily
MAEIKNITDFVFELGAMKHVKRSGWWIINVKDPENVAEHSFRAGVVGYLLAKLEKADVNKVALMSFFNDLHEARLNDLHKVGHRYIDFKKAELAAREEQAQGLGEIGQELLELHKEFIEQKTKEAIVARDADLLENAFQAKEYIEIGYKDAQDWIDNVKKKLVTESAKKMLKEIEKSSSNDWWYKKKLKKIER